MTAPRCGAVCLLLLAWGAAALPFVHELVDTALVQVPIQNEHGKEGEEPAHVQEPAPGAGGVQASAQGNFPSIRVLIQHELVMGLSVTGRLLKELIVPVVAVLLGLLGLLAESTRLVGKMALFFGAQTFMNLYMKAVLSKSVVSSELGMAGVPAAFAITAIQQLVSFTLLGAGALASQMTPWKYTPKKLTTPRHLGMVLIFSLTFTLNIALNNFSLSMLDISVNLIIRSVAPLTTLIIQLLFIRCLGSKSLETAEVVLMVTGALFGLVAVVAKAHGLPSTADTHTLILGGSICLFSLFCASMELVLVGLLGSGLGLNPIDTTFYMAMPVAVQLFLPIVFVAHPVAWQGYGMLTDWQILKEVIALSPGTFGLVMFSGVFAMVYNILLYNIAQTLSPAFSAFISNFNKAATIALSIFLGFEVLPRQPWGMIQAIGIIGNMVAFTVYGLWKTGKTGDGKTGDGKTGDGKK